MIGRLSAGLMLAFLTFLMAAPADADGVDKRRHTHRHRHAHYHLQLPPERHVIEVVDHRGFFIINGAAFTPLAPKCWHWVAGDRIKFLAGEMHGFCAAALIYNASRRQTCEMRCG